MAEHEEEHADHLAAVLRLLRKHQLYDKLSKCSLFQSQVHYLGRVISKEGIEVDLEIFELSRSGQILGMWMRSEHSWDYQVITGGSSGTS